MTSSKIQQLLVRARVQLKIWHLPDELRQLAIGPVISQDNLIDFHLHLQDDDWLKDQVAECYGTAVRLESQS